MKNVSRRSAIATLSGIAALGLAGCGGNTDSESASADGYTLVNDGQLSVVYSNGFPPFEFSTDDGSGTQGFDIDLITAVAEQMGLECNILPTQKFDTLVPTIKAGGKADVCISAVTINDERSAEIDFSDPYLNSNQALLALATSTYASLEDFDQAGNVLVASAGTTGQTWGEENFSQAEIVPLDDYVSCFTGVSSGLYQGAIADLPVAQYLTEQSYKDLKVCVEVPTGEQYGIVVSKDNPGLTKAINEALAALQENGTVDEIKIKWFGTTEGL